MMWISAPTQYPAGWVSGIGESGHVVIPEPDRVRDDVARVGENRVGRIEGKRVGPTGLEQHRRRAAVAGVGHEDLIVAFTQVPGVLGRLIDAVACGGEPGNGVRAVNDDVPSPNGL